MPGYKVHAVGGAVTFVALFGFLQKTHLTHCASLTALSCFFATILGSLFPDVDTKSKGQMIFYQCILFYLLFLLWMKKVTMFMIVTCITMVPLLVPHRGLFHRISFLFCLTGAASCAAFVLVPERAFDSTLHLLFFLAGAVSHVVLDRTQTAIKFL